MNLLRIGLSTYRLTKLVLDDQITEKMRNKAYELAEGHDNLTYFLGCPWCISVYAGAIAVIIDKTVPEVNTVLGSSAITGLVYTHLG